MRENGFREAALPLLEAGTVEAIEWSPDCGWGEPLPGWGDDLLSFYGARGRLYGHGVTYSPLSAGVSDGQRRWLERMRRDARERSYRHLSEHFGFMTAEGWAQGTPLPVPFVPEALAAGREHLRRLAEAAGGIPVGLENLALTFGPDDMSRQGEFLDALLSPVDGFLVLDLHNLYCQSANFSVPIEDLLTGYPLARVREIHISGGSWSVPSASCDAAQRPVRRDTHDSDVPGEVFRALEGALPRCPAAEVVILERLGGTLPRDEDRAGLQRDFRRLCSILGANRNGG